MKNWGRGSDYTYLDTAPDGQILEWRGGVHVSTLNEWPVSGTTIRVIGDRNNSSLLVRLAKHQDENYIVQTCSPLLAGSRNERRNPTKALRNVARVADRAPSLGGWRHYGLSEYLGHQCALCPDDEARMAYAKDHPVYRALSFLTPRDDVAVAKLLGLIIDPRNFVDPNNPDDPLTKLEAYLGLSKSKPRPEHLEVVRGCVGLTSDVEYNRNDPSAYFLLINWLRNEKIAIRGYLSFLIWAWLDVVSLNRPADPILDPTYVFDDETAAVFTSHWNSFQSG